jgi:hypothetical protein
MAHDIDMHDPSSCCMIITGEQGKHMTDTIDWLESIGSDASLRHASTEELTNLLEQAQASEALMAAVASGDGAQLSAEFGQLPNQAPQMIQSPAHEEEEEGEEPLETPAPENSHSSSLH